MLKVSAKRSSPYSRRSTLPDRIILTGFRATGKSAVGVILAERLGLDFIDTDARLCCVLGSSVAEYVQREGWPAFRQREKEFLRQLASVTRHVISTGGGAVLHEEEWCDLRKNSLVVWLQADAETIRQRIKLDATTVDQRPPLSDNDTGDEVEELLASRSSLYLEGSDMSVDTAELTPEETVNMIEKEISQGG
jgi:shikimate kinase